MRVAGVEIAFLYASGCIFLNYYYWFCSFGNKFLLASFYECTHSALLKKDVFAFFFQFFNLLTWNHLEFCQFLSSSLFAGKFWAFIWVFKSWTEICLSTPNSNQRKFRFWPFAAVYWILAAYWIQAPNSELRGTQR